MTNRNRLLLFVIIVVSILILIGYVNSGFSKKQADFTSSFGVKGVDSERYCQVCPKPNLIHDEFDSILIVWQPFQTSLTARIFAVIAVFQ